MTKAPAYTSKTPESGARWYVPEAMATWFIPGLGHYLIGEKRRAIILFSCITLLWVSGLLIGGPGVIDWNSTSAPIVRRGQYGLFQSFAFEWYRKRYMLVVPAGLAAGELPKTSKILYRQSFNRLEEQGVLFIAIAGMLNIMAVIDVVHRSSGSTPGSTAASNSSDEDAPSGGDA